MDAIAAPAVVAAIVSGVISVATLLVGARRHRVDRQRQLFAEAFGAVAEYREYPYIVRRRRSDAPEGERQRISASLSSLQARLQTFRAQLLVEDQRVGEAFDHLVTVTRRVTGPTIRDAWNSPAIAADEQMSLSIEGPSELEQADARFLEAARDHLGLVPVRLARLGRRIGSYLPRRGCPYGAAV